MGPPNRECPTCVFDMLGQAVGLVNIRIYPYGKFLL